MGVALNQLLEAQETTIEALQGKVLAVDAMNMLYQFLTTIRQQDGTPLKDSKGNITSHLTGLFSRCTRLLQKNIKLIFVFDGQMPKLKAAERAYRDEQKAKALEKLKDASAQGNIAEMKKYASRTVRINDEMLEESKKLLRALGIPIIQAPSEGEAQAAHLVVKGDADYVASQDFDCLIYGGPKVVRNLSISQKRKKINALTYKTIQPEILTLEDTLQQLNLTLDQLRVLAMLIGTDFNRGGVKGLGPKKGLALVQKHGENSKELFEEINFNEESHATWEDIFDTIKNMPTTDEYTITYTPIDKEAVRELLVTEHDFSSERIDNALEQIDKARNKSRQQNLNAFFG